MNEYGSNNGAAPSNDLKSGGGFNKQKPSFNLQQMPPYQQTQ